MGRTARRDALLVPYDGEISKYSGVMLRRNTLSDTGFHGVRKIDVKGGVKFQAVVFDRVRKKLKACGTFRDSRDAAAEVAVREAQHRDEKLPLDSPRKHRTRGTAGVCTPAMPHEHVVASACVAQPLAVASAVPVPRPCGYFEFLPHCPIGTLVRMPPIASEELPSPALLPFLNTDI